ncbi:conserved hypothetical protein [Gammaproteobacteria bacterium]
MNGNDCNRPDDVLRPFPEKREEIPVDKANPAIRLYGRRFYKDQTPVEYLAEFLLVFTSPKQDPKSSKENDGRYSFILSLNSTPPRYWPENRVALKLFSFFPSSKLETRHPAHQKAYLDALEKVKGTCNLGCSEDKKDEMVRLLQSLFGGFIGVAKNRTWVTHTFLPVSTALLASELVWLHPRAIKNSSINCWDDSKKYFESNHHIFMARGGELLFLQMANLFSDPNAPELTEMLAQKPYQHLGENRVIKLANRLEQQLRKLLEEAVAPLSGLARLIEETLKDYQIDSQTKSSNLGWVPVASRIEALLFAQEMDNLCAANLSALEKLDLLQTLCSMQVLRSLCFQARRIDGAETFTFGFIGNYAWIAADPKATTNTSIRQMAQDSFSHIEALLYRVLRNTALSDSGGTSSQKEADKNGFQLFRKIAKEIGLVIPRTGGGQRFVLTPDLLRFLVSALLRPGERIRMTDFYQRVFAHYGIALGGQSLAIALDWNNGETGTKNYAVAVSTNWIEEALQQGGFLVELSDAVSIVHNPG